MEGLLRSGAEEAEGAPELNLVRSARARGGEGGGGRAPLVDAGDVVEQDLG
jgi:hypothetical protein